MLSRRNVLHLTALSLGAALVEAATSTSATSVPPEVAAELPGALIGPGSRMRFFGFDVYDARLIVPADFRAGAYAESTFALELSYLRSLSGTAIAERSLKEMARAGALDDERAQRWLTAMVDAFPDVKAGDRITGLHVAGVGARFWFNGQARATIRDTAFARLFFGIWLGASTSEPRLREELLRGLPA